ncbi:Uncharacterized conserved protein YchJ, contains N-and C-terminal SEC-C domains [Gulbenkiania indica]|uniref:UPF0225 protein Ga0061063_1018 n=1 Tax=Gulbenkiania indica TaxID=375574 RepID=A0A0K6GU79_9NEIS|nr:Uncharacterized conserved protein YchJ, contains N-and C-terminal SEC-C domains [Gulbenkiania indica]
MKPNASSGTGCPCGRPVPFDACCGRYLPPEAAPAPTAEALMRSRYTAYVMGNEPYLMATWHATTRPERLGLADEQSRPRWLGLSIVRSEGGQNTDTHGLVEFVARYKIQGRAFRLHETSRFLKEDGRWWYVDGDLQDS